MRGSRPHNPQSDYIIIDGIWFYKEKKGKYYMGNVLGEDGKRHPVRAHRYVWEKYNGKMPPLSTIHHIDHDPRNNDISNLQLMYYASHAKMHSLEHSDKSRENMLKTVIPAAAMWHHSEEAKEWHRKHYEETTREKWMAPITKHCEVCGKEYQTTQSSAGHSRFCSNSCKATFRRRSGVDNVSRNCVVCGSEFTCNKYSKQASCGKDECVKALKLINAEARRRQELNQ